jgi:hypothetical protein
VKTLFVAYRPLDTPTASQPRTSPERCGERLFRAERRYVTRKLRIYGSAYGCCCRAIAFLSTLPTGVVGSMVISTNTSGRAWVATPRWSR